VGAALRFADGGIVTGTNIENASYGLALCAETVAVGTRDGRGPARRAGSGGGDGAGGRTDHALRPLPPGAQRAGAIGRTDPQVLCVGPGEVRRTTLSALLPDAFGPASLG
jgi:cytidine deaminase